MSFRRPEWADDRGATTLAWAILGPVVLLLTFTALQAGYWFYARSIALSAAQECVNAARGTTGTESAGHGAATEFAQRVGSGSFVLSDVTVTGGDTVECTVKGRSVSLVGDLKLPVTQSASGPRERTPNA